MRKIYIAIFTSLSATMMISLTSHLNAQRTVTVDQGVGTLNEAIAADTTATGERVDSNTVYVLQDGGTYLVTGTIENRFPLTIMAEEGASVKPKVYPAVDAGNESSRLFVPRDDFTLIGLDISNTDELGARNKNTIRIKGDNARIWVEDCIINEDTQAPFRCDGANLRIFVKNCIISNMDQDYNNGRVIDDRGNAVDTIWIEHSTIYNIGSRLIRDGGEMIKYFHFDHNTVVNTGRRVMDVGEVQKAVITNNIMQDCGILGQDTAATSAIIVIDSIDGTQDVLISHNHYYIDPGYTAGIPDTATAVPLLNPTAQAWVEKTQTASTLYGGPANFINAPAPNYNQTTDWWANPDTEATPPDFSKDGGPFDFGYANSKLFAGGTMGQALGDPRWDASESSERTVFVDQGVGTLNEAIAGDTTATGARVDSNTTYILQDGGIYLTTGTIENRFPLTIMAEEGASVKPKVYPAVDAGNESSRLFVPRDDFTLIGLDISNTDELGARNKNTIRIKGDNARIWVEDCIINEDTQAPFRCDGENLRIFVKNCIISNMDQDYNNGRVIDDRGNALNTILIENSTIYNIGSRLIRDGGAMINNFYFNHNTVYNTGRRVMDVGEVQKAVITNNIMQDCGILGQESDATSGIINIDSIAGSQDVLISNNHYHIDTNYLNGIPDTAMAVPLFNATAQAWVDEKQTGPTMYSIKIAFNNAPAPNYNQTTDWWANPDTEATPPDFTKDGGPFDFGYANTLLSTGGTEGQALGDPRWDVTTDISHFTINSSELTVFPVPVDNYATIRFSVISAAQVELTVFDIMGKKVAALEYGRYPAGVHSITWNGTSDAGQLLKSGMYILRMKAGQDVSTVKILKQ